MAGTDVTNPSPQDTVFAELIHGAAKGCIFDLDGTLLSSNDARTRSWKQALEKKGMTIDKATYMQETGKSGIDIVDSLCRQQGKHMSQEDKTAIYNDETEFYDKEGLKEVQPIPVVIDIAKAAQARGLLLAVATGSEETVAQKMIQDYGLHDLFNVVVSSKDVKGLKPHPDIFHAAADRIGLKASDCVVFEDSKNGIEAAKKAGALRVVNVCDLPGHPDYQKV